MKYYILLAMLAAPALHATQSPTRKCYMPAPMAFRKKPAEMPKYKSIASQVHEVTTKTINPALNDALIEAISSYEAEDKIRQLFSSKEIPDINAEIQFGPRQLTPLNFLLRNDIRRDRESLHKIALLLIEAGADVNAMSSDRETALSLAIRDNDIELIKMLLKAGANINLPFGGKQTTPLMLAASGSSAKIVKLLLKAGADINMLNNQGETVFDYIKSFPHSFNFKEMEKIAPEKSKIRDVLIDYVKLNNQSKASESAVQNIMEKALEKQNITTMSAQDPAEIVHSFSKQIPQTDISTVIRKQVSALEASQRRQRRIKELEAELSELKEIEGLRRRPIECQTM